MSAAWTAEGEYREQRITPGGGSDGRLLGSVTPEPVWGKDGGDGWGYRYAAAVGSGRAQQFLSYYASESAARTRVEAEVERTNLRTAS